jgi:hypothetical protein
LDDVYQRLRYTLEPADRLETVTSSIDFYSCEPDARVLVSQGVGVGSSKRAC